MAQVELCFIVSGTTSSSQQALELDQAKVRSHAAIVGHYRSKNRRLVLRGQRLSNPSSGSYSRWRAVAVRHKPCSEDAASAESCLHSDFEANCVKCNIHSAIVGRETRSTTSRAPTPTTTLCSPIEYISPQLQASQSVHKDSNRKTQDRTAAICVSTMLQGTLDPFFQLAAGLSKLDKQLLHSCSSACPRFV
jgi:hypothetical protein